MEQLVSVRQCGWKDVATTAALSERVLEALEAQHHSDYFGGVDAEEITEAMVEPSIVIIASDERGEIVGFLLLKKPDEEEEKKYSECIENYCKGETLIVNGFGVEPNRKKGKIATKMLDYAKKYALSNGFTKFAGTIHPDNEASKKSLQHVSKKKMKKGEPFIHETRDKRRLLRQYFNLELK